MKTARETAEAALKSLQTSSMKSHAKTSSKTDIPISWVSALFKKFQIRYGHRWVSAIEGIEVEAIAEWQNELSGLTGKQIKHGVDSWDGDWPPSVVEFKKSCIGKTLNDFGLDYVPECYRKRPERQRDRLLSSDDRDSRRAGLSERIRGLKAALK